MKKVRSISLALAAAIVFSLLFCGCDGKQNEKGNQGKSAAPIIADDGIGTSVDEYMSENPKFDCSQYSVGDTMIYGSFEQDNNTDNGTEPLEWTVIEADKTHLLLITKYGIYPASYHWENTKFKYTTWETSSIREWLNGKFYQETFTDYERQFIALNKIENMDNPTFGIDGGNDTEDYVYFLSHDEALKYFPRKEEKMIKPTEYALAHGAFTNKAGYGYWWLRTPGKFRCNAEYVFDCGVIYEYGSDVGHNCVCCRPVIRIEHNAVK